MFLCMSCMWVMWSLLISLDKKINRNRSVILFNTSEQPSQLHTNKLQLNFVWITYTIGDQLGPLQLVTKKLKQECKAFWEPSWTCAPDLWSGCQPSAANQGTCRIRKEDWRPLLNSFNKTKLIWTHSITELSPVFFFKGISECCNLA